jgi:hypothetical protein
MFSIVDSGRGRPPLRMIKGQPAPRLLTYATLVSAASRCHQQPSALRKLHRETSNTARGSVYEHLLAWNHAAALFRMEESLKSGERRNGDSGSLSET